MGRAQIFFSGASLIEVLIAIFLLTLSALSVLSLQHFAFVQNYNSYLHSISTLQLNNLVETFRLDQGARGFDLWNKTNALLLPHGIGSYSGDKFSGYKVKLCWQQQNGNEDCVETNVK